jgi:hypothetical protein
MNGDFLLEIVHPVTDGNVSETLPLLFLPDTGSIPLLCGQLQANAGADPTATVQVTVNFGPQASLTTPEFTFSSPTQFFTFVLPNMNPGATPQTITYSATVSGSSGEWALFLRIK